MNKTSIAAALCLVLVGSSAHAAMRPLAKVRAAMPTLHPIAMAQATVGKAKAATLPGLGAANPVGVRVAGIDLAGAQGKGLLAGLGVASGASVGHGIVGASVLGGRSSGTGLVGIGALSGVGSGRGAVSVGVANAGQTPLHVGVLGKDLIGH